MHPIEFPVLFQNGKPTRKCCGKRGIYCWVNVASGKKYVGMAAGIEGFRGRLLAEARTEKHAGAPLLQAAFKKYGVESFVALEIVVLDGADAETFAAFERAMIKSLGTQAPNGYNITEGGFGTLGFSSLSAAAKKRGVARPDISAMRSKRSKLVSPDGVVHNISNLSAFANSLGFPPGAFYKIASGNGESYRGWRLNTVTRETYAKRMAGEAYFVSPDKELVKVKNISRFAAQNGLSQGQIHGVWLKRKSYNTCKGWIRATEDQISKFDPLLHKTWEHDGWQ